MAAIAFQPETSNNLKWPGEKLNAGSSWEFSLKSSGHDVFKKLYFLRDIPGRQKKTVSIF